MAFERLGRTVKRWIDGIFPLLKMTRMTVAKKNPNLTQNMMKNSTLPLPMHQLAQGVFVPKSRRVCNPP